MDPIKVDFSFGKDDGDESAAQVYTQTRKFVKPPRREIFKI